jgi:hypothetical protein
MERLLEQFLLAIGWRPPNSAAVTRFIQRNHVTENWGGNLRDYWLSPDETEYTRPPDYLDSRNLAELIRIIAEIYTGWSLCSTPRRVFEVFWDEVDVQTFTCSGDTPQEALIRFIVRMKKEARCRR